MMKAPGWLDDRVTILNGAEESPRCKGQIGG
jgi:hypothetical protein